MTERGDVRDAWAYRRPQRRPDRPMSCPMGRPPARLPGRARTAHGLACAGLACAAVTLAGCEAPRQRNIAAIQSYYAYEFTDARDALRRVANDGDDEDMLLDSMRLGVAAMADGDFSEAEVALTRSFELLSTAGLNADRTTGSVFVNEGIRIWKGEPFEQALGYAWVASLYATLGDWENARAAASNSLFRLTDFGQEHGDKSDVARDAAESGADPGDMYTAVDTDFALGFVLQAIGSDLTGASGAADGFDAALEIDPDLAPVVETLRAGAWDTLLIVDFGKGPTKQAYGPDAVLTRFTPQDDGPASLSVVVDGTSASTWPPICDVVAMSRDLRWNAFEDVRQFKSIFGRTLEAGGFAVAASGAKHDDPVKGLIGVGMMLFGAVSRSNAAADTRYMEFAPQLVFLAPLELGERSDLELTVEHAIDGTVSRLVLPDVAPGTADAPRTIYLRLHGLGSPQPFWLEATDLQHGNEHVPVRPGEVPWVLGGTDTRWPTPDAVAAWQDAGVPGPLTVGTMESILRDEGFVDRFGLAASPDDPNRPFRHALEGGSALASPAADSLGYKRLMYTPHAPHEPRREQAAALAASVPAPSSGPDEAPTP